MRAECDFVNNEDYGVCSPNLASKPRGGHNTIDYWLTLDASTVALIPREVAGVTVYLRPPGRHHPGGPNEGTAHGQPTP